MANNMMGAMLQMLGQQQALGQLGEGYKNAVGRYKTNYYDPFTKAFAGAPGMLANSFGLGGAEGNKAALEAFQAGPAYQFQLGQGLDAINRSAASRGMLASGNNSMDLNSFAQNLANKEFNNWRSGLSGLSQMGMNAAAGQTGRQGSLAGLDMGYGQGSANITQNAFNNMSKMFGQPEQSQGSLGGAIAGGLNLAGSLMGGPMGGSIGNFIGGMFR